MYFVYLLSISEFSFPNAQYIMVMLSVIRSRLIRNVCFQNPQSRDNYGFYERIFIGSEYSISICILNSKVIHG